MCIPVHSGEFRSIPVIIRTGKGLTSWLSFVVSTMSFFFFLVIRRALSGASSHINYVQGCCEAHQVQLKTDKNG